MNGPRHDGSAKLHLSERTSAYFPFTALRALSPSTSTLDCVPPPTTPAIVRCMSVHSDSRGSAMSPMSYTYSFPSLPPSAARLPSLRSHCSLLIARPWPTVVETDGTCAVR